MFENNSNPDKHQENRTWCKTNDHIMIYHHVNLMLVGRTETHCILTSQSKLGLFLECGSLVYEFLSKLKRVEANQSQNAELETILNKLKPKRDCFLNVI